MGHFLGTREIYPPGYHLLLVPAIIVTGASDFSGVYANLVAAAILLWATHRLGARLFDSRTGLCAAALVCVYPALAIFSREPLAEYLLTAWTALTLVFLLEIDGFEGRCGSFGLGACVGIGLLIKPTYPFFTWLPLTVAGTLAILARSRRRLVNLLAAFLVAAALATLWYLPHWRDALALAATNRSDALRWRHAGDGWTSFLEYLSDLSAYLTTGLGTVVASIGLAWSARTAFRRARVLHASVVGGWFIVIVGLVYREHGLGQQPEADEGATRVDCDATRRACDGCVKRPVRDAPPARRCSACGSAEPVPLES